MECKTSMATVRRQDSFYAKNLTNGKPNGSKKQPIKAKNNKTMVYLPGRSNVIDWMEQNSMGAEKMNQVLTARHARIVQKTQTNANVKVTIRLKQYNTCSLSK